MGKLTYSDDEGGRSLNFREVFSRPPPHEGTHSGSRMGTIPAVVLGLAWLFVIFMLCVYKKGDILQFLLGVRGKKRRGRRTCRGQRLSSSTSGSDNHLPTTGDSCQLGNPVFDQPPSYQETISNDRLLHSCNNSGIWNTSIDPLTCNRPVSEPLAPGPIHHLDNYMNLPSAFDLTRVNFSQDIDVNLPKYSDIFPHQSSPCDSAEQAVAYELPIVVEAVETMDSLESCVIQTHTQTFKSNNPGSEGMTVSRL